MRDFWLVLAGALSGGFVSLILFWAGGIREKKNRILNEQSSLDGLISVYIDYTIYLYYERINNHYCWSSYQLTAIQNKLVPKGLLISTQNMFEKSQVHMTNERDYISKITDSKKALLKCICTLGKLKKIDISCVVKEFINLENMFNLEEEIEKINSYNNNIQDLDIKRIAECNVMIKNTLHESLTKLIEIEKSYRKEFEKIKKHFLVI